jgi:hypothetical protein
MFIGPAIPFSLMVARDSRESRAKYLRWARKFPHGELREIELSLAAMFKRHEKKWLAEYQKDLEIANA